MVVSPVLICVSRQRTSVEEVEVSVSCNSGKLFSYSLSDNKAKSRVMKVTLVCVDVIYSHVRIFVQLFESLRLSITSTNGNRPKACFSNTISPYFGRVCKVSRTDKFG